MEVIQKTDRFYRSPFVNVPDRKANLSTFSRVKEADVLPQSGDLQGHFVPSSPSCVQENWHYPVCGDDSVFSSSLPVLFNKKLHLSSVFGQSVNLSAVQSIGELLEDSYKPIKKLEAHTIGSFLPNDEDELLAGINDSIALLVPVSNTEESEEFDLFSSGGGLELDTDVHESFGIYANSHKGLDNIYGSNGSHPSSSNGTGSAIREHPYGEHPSRTLFVRNINSNVEDTELRGLFEQYGAIRSLYTACKHRGFVMISYYDIRAARSAMRALQNKPLRRRKLDIHFSIPKGTASDKDVNQGTLVVFNLDPSVSNGELRQIFGQYGEIKEVRETPHKQHHKFIEFYDVRAAESALRALNRSDIAGKQIKLEPSRPGGARRSLMQQLHQEVEHDEGHGYRQQTRSPLANSLSGYGGIWDFSDSPGGKGYEWSDHSSMEYGSLVSSIITEPQNGTVATSVLPFVATVDGGPIRSHPLQTSRLEVSPSDYSAAAGAQRVLINHSHSFPDYSNSVTPFFHNTDVTSSAWSISESQRILDGTDATNLNRTIGGDANGTALFEHISGGVVEGSKSVSGIAKLVQCNSGQFHQACSTSAMGHSFDMAGHIPPQYGFVTECSNHMPSTLLHWHQNVCRLAPGESPESSFLSSPVAAGKSIPLVNTGSSFANYSSLENGASSPNRLHMFPFSSLSISERSSDYGKIRRMGNSTTSVDEKKQYQLHLDSIMRGEDIRTTLMIKNIPNKYTSKMLLVAIDEKTHGTYDFLYLPIDFKNKCNVGYAFINMTAPVHIIPFFKAFHGKKWEKFNSEKIAVLAYARIQGKAALVSHFQNSSLMNEDKRCRPILFHSGQQEPFPLVTTNIRAKVSKASNGITDSSQDSVSAKEYSV